GAGGLGGGRDDYAGLDVRGKVALAVDGGPSRLEKLLAARRAGARALLIAAETPPPLDATAARVNLLSATVTRSAATALLGAPGRFAGAPPRGATGIEVHLRIALERADRRTANVIAVLPGTDPALAGQMVVIGAHYDHLGRADGAVYHGADDNASGVAVVLGLARAFAATGGAPRTLVFAFFSGEELGLLGSGHYVRQPGFDAARVAAMVNFDMVGRLGGSRPTVGGLDSAPELRALIADISRAESVEVAGRGHPSGGSDHARFYSAGVPVLFFHTGSHADYHRPTDTADKIDAPGMARIAAVGARVIERLATGPRPVYARVPTPRERPTPTAPAGGAFLGVSARGREPGDGVALGAVVPGSPAAHAGLRDGDVLVRLADVSLRSFDDLRGALATRRPGDAVPVLFLRDGEGQSASCILGSR
ncbi:MAG: M20/M25/M40 family metallo-hydrolase, partial [Candidatus Rokubacteria bacterium]|nr:M20/M25/M40 family metallo-hydrolase [Candidatus Rokubacteria bacterium]